MLPTKRMTSELNPSNGAGLGNTVHLPLMKSEMEGEERIGEIRLVLTRAK